jgi:hypothetical protein
MHIVLICHNRLAKVADKTAKVADKTAKVAAKVADKTAKVADKTVCKCRFVVGMKKGFCNVQGRSISTCLYVQGRSISNLVSCSVKPSKCQLGPQTKRFITM